MWYERINKANRFDDWNNQKSIIERRWTGVEDPVLELYETIIIFKPLSEETIKNKVDDILNILRSKPSWKQIRVNNIGKRKLAYSIKDTDYGHYVTFQYLSDRNIVNKLITYIQKEDTIVKYITMKSDENPDEVLEDELKPGNSIDAYEVLLGLKNYD